MYAVLAHQLLSISFSLGGLLFRTLFGDRHAKKGPESRKRKIKMAHSVFASATATDDARPERRAVARVAPGKSPAVMRELYLRHEYGLPLGVSSAVITYGGRSDIKELRRLAGNKTTDSLSFEVEFNGTLEKPAETALFTNADMEFLFGRHVTAFVSHPSVPHVGQDMYKHFNFGESLDDHNDYNDPSFDFGWKVESVWLSDGSFRGEEAGFIYGRDAADKKVYELDMYTFLFAAPLNPSLHQRSVGDTQASPKRRARSRIGRIMAIYKTILAHVNEEVDVNNPLGRGFSSRVPDYIYPGLTVEYRDNTGECSRASIDNGMYILGRKDEAAIFWAEQMAFVADREKKGEISRIRNHCDLSKEVQNFGFSLEFPKDENGNKMKGTVGVRWFYSCPCYGVYVATLVAKSGYKHDITIDARQCPIVYDCHEFSVLKYSEGCLRACMGDYAEFDYITDVRKLVPPGNSNKRSRTQRRNDAKRVRTE